MAKKKTLDDEIRKHEVNSLFPRACKQNYFHFKSYMA